MILYQKKTNKNATNWHKQRFKACSKQNILLSAEDK